jgi:hypothetical protein
MQVKLDDTGYNNYRFRDETWQRELWRLYDIVPEFRAAASWVGQCCSRVRIYVAEVDKLGRVQGEATKASIAALSDSIFGNPGAKSELLRACGINMTVAGEFFILGQAGADETDGDRWFVLSSSEVRRTRNGDVYWGPKLGEQIVNAAREMITRVWTPHPQRILYADSPARACQPVLRELEQLTKFTFSQIDSRLAGAGMLIIPNNLDFPADDSQSTASESLMMRLAEAMSASLKGEGQATALVPLILEADPADIDRGFKYISFATELSKQVMEMKAEAVKRLGTGLDMPTEALTGMGDASHWSAWHIEESGVKLHIEPLMNRICTALTRAYLKPALKVMGQDPGRYIFWFDTAPLTVRPQRFTDALNLYEKGLLSADAVRDAGYFKDSEKQDETESARIFVREVVLRDPQLFSMQGVRELAGITEEMLPQTAIAPPAVGAGAGPGLPGMGGSGPPPPPPPPTGIQTTLPNPLPGVGSPPPIPTGMPPAGGLPKGGPPGGGLPAPAMHASAGQDQMYYAALLVAAESTVRRGLELAGGRLLTRHERDRWPDVPRHELHTRIKVMDASHALKLMNGAFSHLQDLSEMLGIDSEPIKGALNEYCSALLTTGTPHNKDVLYNFLKVRGFLG